MVWASGDNIEHAPGSHVSLGLATCCVKRASFGFYEINFKCWRFCALVRLIAFLPPTPPLFHGFYQCNGCLLPFSAAGRLMAVLSGFASHGTGLHLGAGYQ